jgi:hypothetical protein
MLTFTKPRTGFSMYNLCIGVMYLYTKMDRDHVYEVTDKQLFMLSVIKYGLEFKEIR